MTVLGEAHSAMVGSGKHAVRCMGPSQIPVAGQRHKPDYFAVESHHKIEFDNCQCSCRHTKPALRTLSVGVDWEGFGEFAVGWDIVDIGRLGSMGFHKSSSRSTRQIHSVERSAA